MRLLQAYEDENDDESYFACAWCSSRRSDAALLAVAGQTGVVRVIDATPRIRFRYAYGLKNHHHPRMMSQNASAPVVVVVVVVAPSLRLYSVDNGVCACASNRSSPNPSYSDSGTFAIDFKLTDPRGIDGRPVQDIVFACGAMDNQVKVWSTAGYTHLVARSETCGGTRRIAQRFPDPPPPGRRPSSHPFASTTTTSTACDGSAICSSANPWTRR